MSFGPKQPFIEKAVVAMRRHRTGLSLSLQYLAVVELTVRGTKRIWNRYISAQGKTLNRTKAIRASLPYPSSLLPFLSTSFHFETCLVELSPFE